MNIQVTIDISTEMVEDLLITANMHCGYWCQITRETETPSDALSSYTKVLDDKYAWIEYGIVDAYEGTLTPERKLLTKSAIQSGLKVMSEKHSKHFSDLLNENHDMMTADVFLQCCLLGGIVYG